MQAHTMTYDIYLEIDARGLCLAHVPSLPGCVLRAASRDAALAALPAAILDYCDWLRHHGEPVPPCEGTPGFRVIEEITGLGPFDPGDAAALLPPDREPVTVGEMEWYFRLMDHSRAGLLSLLGAREPGASPDLPSHVLDWQCEPGSFTLRRLLRHLGNAEEWYVSRLVPPETLPLEWQNDEDLPLFEFLAMERRTAVERLRGLTDDERSAIVYPAHWTEHPEEPWTARKAVRRFLEHEREHTGQVHDILAAYHASVHTLHAQADSSGASTSAQRA